MTDLQKKFKEEISPSLQKEFGFKNKMAVPNLVKIVLNTGLKEGLKDQKISQEVVSQITKLAGQKAVVTRAKAAIAGFKLRKGDPIGVMVTLRGHRMFDFFEKLIRIVLPRVRDFRGIPTTSFDGYGNYTLGFSDMSVFPEIDTIVSSRSGIEISIVTTANKDGEARRLLEIMGMPFKKVKS